MFDIMARRDEQQRGLFAQWWANQSDRHYQIITNVSILSVALLVWGVVFLFGLSGASDPSKENLVALTWVGMVVGGIGTFYVAPEFFYYLGQKQLLDDILLLDSRAEVLRRRKEGEDAAIMLGSRYMKLMRGLLEMHQIPVGKNLSLGSITPNRKSEILSSSKKSWWSNTDSVLSHRLPGLDILRTLFYHRLSILILLGSTIILSWNNLFGLATQSGSREYTIDLTERISGSSSYYQSAPHFDPVSIILILFFLLLLYSTRPFYDKED
jgi:hypothetical protein